MIDFFLFRKPISPYFIFAVKPNSVASATCETFGIGLGFRLVNLPCSGNYPFSIKRCATTQNPTALNLEVQRLQKAIEFTNQTVCEESYRRMCSRVHIKVEWIPANDFGGQQFSQLDSKQSAWRVCGPRSYSFYAVIR